MTDNLNAVRRSLAAGAAGDAGAAMALFAPDVVAHYASDLPWGGPRHGLDAYLAALGELNTALSLEVHQATPVACGERSVLLVLDITYTHPLTRESARQTSVEVLTFSGEHVIDVSVCQPDPHGLVRLLAGGTTEPVA